jgi:putative nucleotidyltransferase with HDIG domain
LNTVIHRIKQFWRAMHADVQPQEIAELAEYLNQAQRMLFLRMAVSDQRHSLDLFYDLRACKPGDEALLQAALLHDIGKSLARIHLWHRVAFVLLGGLPYLRARLCAGPRRDWRQPFFVLANHTELGAELARRAGSSEDVVALIRVHQQPVSALIPPVDQQRLRALQAADDD